MVSSSHLFFQYVQRGIPLWTPDHGFHQLVPLHGSAFMGEPGPKCCMWGDVVCLETRSFALLFQLPQNWKLQLQFASLVLWQKANNLYLRAFPLPSLTPKCCCIQNIHRECIYHSFSVHVDVGKHVQSILNLFQNNLKWEYILD